MRRTFVGWWALAIYALAGGVLVPAAEAQPAAHHHVTVGPSLGYPGTWFRVRFRAPDSTGNVNGMRRYYVVSASGPSSSDGCASQAVRDVAKARAGTRVRVRLTPGANGWCLGHFRGAVTEEEQPSCQFRKACPNYVVLVRTVGRFSFRVQSQPPGGDDTPPVFAGLESAVGCTGGPERLGETIAYKLSWEPAHDQVTPRARIVYDIFMSNGSGGENFSSPNWTTRPGANSFKTPRLPVATTHYFVVRARDQAGNEDQNRVQRRGVDPCV